MTGYPIHQKLMIAATFSALFDLSESHMVFRELARKTYVHFVSKA